MKKRGSCVLTRWQHDGGMAGEICFLIRRAVMPWIPGKWPQHAPRFLHFASGMATASPTMPLQARRPLMESRVISWIPGSPLFSTTRKDSLSRAAGARLGLRRQTDQTLEEAAEQASTEPNHREWRRQWLRNGNASASPWWRRQGDLFAKDSSGSSTTVMLTRESARSGPSPRCPEIS